MLASPARIEANRKNSALSTGPKTSEGKERSRANAIKHGLTGAGVALSTENAALVAERVAGFEADFRPTSEAGQALVRRAALLSVRMERCVVHESSTISAAVRSAVVRFDEAREAEVEQLMDSIGDNPARTLRRLMRMPEGVERLIDTWTQLLEDLNHDNGSRWGEKHGAMAVSLTGRKVGGFGISRAEALSKAVAGDFSLVGEHEGEGLDVQGRRQWARQALAATMVETLAKLEAHRETLDVEAIEADRAEAPARALFDPSREATLARKYEAAAVRELYRALKELREIEEKAAQRPATPPIPAKAPVFAKPLDPSMGSFLPAAPARAVSPVPTPAAVVADHRFASSDSYSYVPFAIGKAPGRSV